MSKFIFILFCLFILKDFKSQPSFSEFKAENNQYVLSLTDLEELHSNGIISDIEANQLSYFLKSGGTFINFYQLQGILCERSVAQINEILPFLLLPAPQKEETLRKIKWSAESIKSELRYMLPMLTNQSNEWFLSIDSSFLGPPISMQYKGQFYFSNWRFAIQMAKDSGEPFWQSGPKGGVDFMSFYIDWNKKQKNEVLSRILLGSYQVQWGQGLQLWTSRGLGKSIDLMHLSRNAPGLKANNSGDEQRYLQGAALVLAKKKDEMLVFTSFKNTDAKLNGNSMLEELTYTYSSGYHRTLNEIAKRKILLEQIFGIGYRKKYELLHLGAMLLYSKSSENPYMTTYSFPLNDFNLSNLSIGFHGQYSFKQFYLYAEAVGAFKISSNRDRSLALNLAFIYYVDTKFEFGLHLRYYSPKYLAFYANAIGNTSTTSNEKGVILQFKSQLSPSTMLKLSSEIALTNFYITTSSLPQYSLDTRIFLQQQSKNKLVYSFGLTHRELSYKSYKLGLQFNAKLPLSKSQLFRFSAQLQRSLEFSNIARQVEFSYRYSALNHNIRFELVYGMFEAVWPAPNIFDFPYLLGVGTQTLVLSGVGNFILGSVCWSLNSNWEFQIHGIYRSNFNPPLTHKIQCGGLFRYKF